MEPENSNIIDTGLACFAIMANYFEKPVFIDQIKHKYDRQNSHFEEYELLQLAKEFSFKAKFVETKWERLDKTALPAIAQSKDGAYFIIRKVRNISGDAIQDEKLGLVFNSRLTLLDNKIKADGQIIQLKPGMSVTAEIKTGKRRVIEYLLSPVMKYLNESMRER